METSATAGVPQVDPDLFEEVGRLCAAWAFLEHSVEQEIWHLLGLREELGSVFTDNMDLQRRWDTLLKVSREQGSLLHGSYLTERKAIETITRDRNLIVHGRIDWRPGEASRMWVISRGYYSDKRTPVSAEFVRRTQGEIRRLARAIRPERFVRWQEASPEHRAWATRS